MARVLSERAVKSAVYATTHGHSRGEYAKGRAAGRIASGEWLALIDWQPLSLTTIHKNNYKQILLSLLLPHLSSPISILHFSYS